MTHKLLLDCDTGIDDTMAILYAALHPYIELVGVGSVWGNVDVTIATRNSLHAVALAGRPEVPVAQGAARPIAGHPPVFAYHVHGDDGQGNAGDPDFDATPVPGSAADQIIRLAKRYPGELHLVAVGPLTNVAIALASCPELPQLLHQVTIMGGAAGAPGNVTPVAEANIWCDPEAAAAVFRAPWDLTMVGLDVTMRTLLTEEHRSKLLQGGPIARYVGGMLDFYFDFFATEAFGERRSCMHDALAVAIAGGTLTPDLAPVVRAEVDTTDGPGRGQTICDLRGRYMGYPEQEEARCRVVLESDTGFADDVVQLLLESGQGRG
jgi:purine nucleosidase